MKFLAASEYRTGVLLRGDLGEVITENRPVLLPVHKSDAAEKRLGAQTACKPLPHIVSKMGAALRRAQSAIQEIKEAWRPYAHYKQVMNCFLGDKVGAGVCSFFCGV